MIDTRSKIFRIGFFIGILLFVSANISSYYRMPTESSIDDGFVDFGIPFKLYAYGGFWTHSVILWDGLLTDILIAVCVSIILGWAFEKLFMNRSRLS